MQPKRSAPTAAVVYAAKSTEDKRGSIPTQLADGEALAERESLPVVGRYSDEAASAFTGNRGPELAAALDHAEKIGGALIVQHSDRLARGDGVQARHLVQLVLEAKQRGITLRSVQDDSSLDNVLMAAAMGERNAEDSRRKGQAVKAGMKRRRERGQYIGHRPYGYQWQRNENDEKVLVIDPAEAAVVRRIFSEYIAGRSQLGITRGLDQDGVRTGRGGKWHQGTVRMLLAQPLYAGWLRNEGGVVPGVHEPIVSKEEWEQAAALREAKRRTHKRGRPVSGQHLFRKGFLRCGVCGDSLIPVTRKNRSGSMYETYACYGRHRNLDSCSMQPVRRAAVDASVFDYFKQVGLDVKATREQMAAASSRTIADVQAMLAAATQQAQTAADRLARVKRDYTHGDITAAEWRELRTDLEPEAEAAEAEAGRLRERLTDAESGAALVSAEADVFEKLAAIRAALVGEVRDAEGTAAVRAALLRLFDGFVLYRAEDRCPPTDGTDVYVDAALWLLPEPRWDAIEGFDEQMRPVIARKPLDTAGENYAKGLTR